MFQLTNAQKDSTWTLWNSRRETTTLCRSGEVLTMSTVLSTKRKPSASSRTAARRSGWPSLAVKCPPLQSRRRLSLVWRRPLVSRKLTQRRRRRPTRVRSRAEARRRRSFRGSSPFAGSPSACAVPSESSSSSLESSLKWCVSKLLSNADSHGSLFDCIVRRLTSGRPLNRARLEVCAYVTASSVSLSAQQFTYDPFCRLLFQVSTAERTLSSESSSPRFPSLRRSTSASSTRWRARSSSGTCLCLLAASCSKIRLLFPV